MGSICGTVKDSIDEMRAQGKKWTPQDPVLPGLPGPEIAKSLKGVKRWRCSQEHLPGSKGALGLEVKDALYGSGIPVYDYIVGLGGRD